MPEELVLLGSIFGLAGCFAFIRDTLLGRSQPNRVTFFLWALSPFIATVASLAAGVTWAAWPTFMSGVGPLLIFCASFKNPKAYWKLGPFDWVCGVLALLAIVLWQVTENPSMAILFAIFADAFPALPTLKKGWTHPDSETVWLYLGGMVTPILGLIVAKNWSFTQTAFPLYLLVICAMMVVSILIGKAQQKRRALQNT